MRRLPKVHEHMDHEVPTLSPRTPIRQAVHFLLENHVTGAPVVDDDGQLVGIVTEFDLLRLLTHGDENATPIAGMVSDYMTSDIVTADPNMDIYYVAGLFLRNRFRRMPVVKDGRVVGAITRFDILRAVDGKL